MGFYVWSMVCYVVLLDFAYCKSYLGVVRLFHLLIKGNQVLFIYNLVKNWAVQTCVHFMKILIVYTLKSHLLNLKAQNHNMYVFCRPLNV